MSTGPIALRPWRRDPNSARDWVQKGVREGLLEKGSRGFEGAQNKIGKGVLS